MTITASPDVEPELRGKRPSRRIGRVRGSWARRAPLLPALIFTVLVTQAPFAVTVLVSFKGAGVVTEMTTVPPV